MKATNDLVRSVVYYCIPSCTSSKWLRYFKFHLNTADWLKFCAEISWEIMETNLAINLLTVFVAFSRSNTQGRFFFFKIEGSDSAVEMF